MSNMIAGKDELHRLVDTLSDVQIAEALDYVQWLLADEDTLTEEEAAAAAAGEAQIARGEFITLDEWKRELDERAQSG